MVALVGSAGSVLSVIIMSPDPDCVLIMSPDPDIAVVIFCSCGLLASL